MQGQTVTETWTTGATGNWNTANASNWTPAVVPNGNTYVVTAGKASVITLNSNETIAEFYDTGGSGTGATLNGSGSTLTMDGTGFTAANLFGDIGTAAIDNTYTANVFNVQPSLSMLNTNLDLGSTSQTTGESVFGVLGTTTINNAGNTSDATVAHTLFFKGIETTAHISVAVNSAIGTSGAPIAIQDLSAGYVELNGAVAAQVTTVEASDTAGTGSRLILFNTGNTYTGNTIVDASAYLNIGNAAGQVIPYGSTAGNILVNGTFEMAGNSQQINGLTGTGTVTNTKWDGAIGGSAVTLTLGNGNTTASYAGTIVGTSGRTIALTKVGSGTQTFTGAGDTIQGNILVSAGTLQIGDGTNATATLGTNAFTDNANLAFNYYAAVSVANAIGGTGTVTQIGSAPLTLTAATSTFSGGLNVNSSSVLAGNANAGVLGSGTVTLAASTMLDINGNSPTTGLLSSTATTAVVTNNGAADGVLTISAAGTGSSTFAGSIAPGATNIIGITKAGTATQILSGANTYVGATTINGGKLALAPTGSLGNTAITVASGGTFSSHPGGGSNFVGSTGAGAIGATLTLNPGTGSSPGGLFDMTDGTIGTFNLLQQAGFTGTALTLGGDGTTSNAPILTFELGASSADKLAVNVGSVSVGATGADISILPLTGLSSLTPGNYTLIDAPGGGLSPLTLASSNVVIGSQSYSLSLANSTSTDEILTVAVSTSTPIYAYWTGAVGTSWSSTGPTNFATDHTGAIPTNGIPGGGSNVFMTADGASASTLSTTLDGAFSINSLSFTGTGTTAASTSVTVAAGSGGSLTLTATNAFQDASSNTYGPGVGVVVQAGSAAHTISAPVTLGSSQAWEIDNDAANPLTVSGVISDATMGYSLTKTGPGSLTLSASNTYTGGTFISNGTLTAAAVGALPANTPLTINGGALDLDGNSQTVSTLNDGGVSTGSIINSGGAATLTINTTVANTYSGSFNSSTGTLILTGSGSLTLSGSTSFGGSVQPNGGTLILASTGVLNGGTTGFVAVGDNGNLTVNGGTVSATSLVTNSKGNSATIINSGSTINISGNLGVDNDNGTVAGYLALNGGTLTANSATVGRTGLNNSSTTVTAGVTGDGIYINGGTLNITTTLTLGATSAANSSANVRMDSGSLTVGGATTITDNNTRYSVLDIAGGTFTGPSVQIGGIYAATNGELLVRGSAVANVGAITFGNVTQTSGNDLLELLGGKLYVGAGGLVNNTTGLTPIINLGGTTYTTAPILAASAPWSSSLGMTLTNSSSGALPIIQTADSSGGAENITLTGALGGAGGFVKTGAGTLTLTGGNFYTGITTINAGTLNINGQFALGGAVYGGTTFNGGTLQYAAAFSGNGTGDITENSASPAVAKPVTFAAGGATIDVNGNAVTYLSPVGNGGSGALTLVDSAGGGSLTLDATNTYTGATNINSGATLQLGDGTSGNDGAIAKTSAVINNGTLIFNRFGSTSSGYAISGTGSVLVTGTGSQTLSGSNSYSGGTNVSGGTLVLSGASAFPATTNLDITAAGKVQIAAHAGTSANVVVVKTNQLTLTGNSTDGWSGLVDVTNNDLTVHSGALADVSSQIATGFSGGTWQGSTGITSSTAAADSTHLTAVGVIQNDMSVNGGSTAPIYGSGTTLGLFDGTNPALDDILVKYTYYGDTNLDGAVDGSDYTNIDHGFTNHLSGWQNGDFNYDGVVDGSDYTLIDNAFNTQGASLGTNPAALIASATSQIAGNGSSVPEPTTFGLIGFGAVGLLGRRRRRILAAGK